MPALMDLVQRLGRHVGFRYLELDRNVLSREVFVHFVYVVPHHADLSRAFVRFIRTHHDEFGSSFGDDFLGGRFTGSVFRRRKGH